MLAASPRGLRRKMGEAVRLIDSTSLRLAGAGAQWTRFSSAVFGAKAHVVYDPDLGRPVSHAVTTANVNAITAAKPMPIDPGATYVFDLGSYDFSWWAQLDDAGCRLVTRFKANTPLREAKAMPLAEGSEVLSDPIGFLPARQGNNRKNPMQEAVREIAVETATGKRLRILTNDLDAPAQEIADLYKRRWQIELFFRVMKQTLKITKFLGRSENAVRIQIAVALIAFLLLRQLQDVAKAKRGFLELARLVRANLMHRKDLSRLRDDNLAQPSGSRQLQLNWATTSTGQPWARPGPDGFTDIEPTNTVDSELSCPVLVAHQMSTSSAFVLLWAEWASWRLVHAVHRVSPPSGFKRRFSHL
jgi:Transposase DDE domain